MKKLILFFLIMLFLLTGCYYSYKDVDDMKEEWEQEYLDLEDKYDIALQKIEDLQTEIGKLNDLAMDLYGYFYDETMSFDDAYDAFDKLIQAFPQ